MNVRLVPRARAEVERAIAWWRSNRDVPALLEEEFAAALALLALSPNVGVPASRAERSMVRRMYLPKSRYHLYYRVRENLDLVDVLRFWHANRGRSPRF